MGFRRRRNCQRHQSTGCSSDSQRRCDLKWRDGRCRRGMRIEGRRRVNGTYSQCQDQSRRHTSDPRFQPRRHLYIQANDSTALFAFHALFYTRGCSAVLGVLGRLTQRKPAHSSSNACHQQACCVMDLSCLKTIEHRRCQLANTIPSVHRRSVKHFAELSRPLPLPPLPLLLPFRVIPTA